MTLLTISLTEYIPMDVSGLPLSKLTPMYHHILY